MKFSTPDLCDAYSELVRVVDPIFRIYGARESFGGEIVTIKCFEDNSLVKEYAEKPGDGKVLVVDGGGSLRRALLGDLLAENASKNGWQGIIIFGAVRDADIMRRIDLGVRALGSIPLKTERKGTGDYNAPVRFGGVTFNPGDFVYADATGIIVAPEPLEMPG